MSDEEARARGRRPVTRRDIDHVLLFLCLVLAQTAPNQVVALLWLAMGLYFLLRSDSAGVDNKETS